MAQNEYAFSALGLNDALVNNLASLNYQKMTPIQIKSLPILLEGLDLIAQAKTGSGKTAAFGLALLHRLNVKHFAIQALVLCPTRELAEQVSQAIRQLARQMHNVKVLNLSGGMPLRPQLDSLRHGAHIIVGTPGRLQKHLTQGSLNLTHLKTLVLDEADRMLDMGFFDEIKSIIQTAPKQRQTVLFSATFPPEIKKIAQEFMSQPQRIMIEEPTEDITINQHFYAVSHAKDKFLLLTNLLRHYRSNSTLIFCNTKEQTSQLATQLKQIGFSTMPLHGDMEQIERDLAVIKFSNKSCSILVATDVAARGLDIKGLPAVINYDLAFEPEVHIHRIGRTGRAGEKGLAITITTPSDDKRIEIIQAQSASPLNWYTDKHLHHSTHPILRPEMTTLWISAGKKDKIRPGDILGVLTKEAGLPGSEIGKIDITPLYSYVAIHQNHIQAAMKHFQTGKLKGMKVIVKKL